MPPPLLEKRWLDRLVTEELERHDPEAALARLPAEVREAASSPLDLAPAAQLLVARSLRRRAGEARPEAAFLDDVRRHVGLLLDLALLRGDPFDAQRRRAEIVAFLAAAVGEEEFAAEAYARNVTRGALARAMLATETALRAQLYPPGDPVGGLPLHPGQVAVQRRRLARVAMGHHRHGRLDPAALLRHAEYAARESALLVEALAGLFAAAAPVAARTLALRQRQLARMGLGRGWLKVARRAVAAPRPPEVLAAAVPERVRPFLAEQLFLAVLRGGLSGDAAGRYVETFVETEALDPAAAATARVEAAAQHGDPDAWFEALDEGSWHAFAEQWEVAADQLVERVEAAVTGNLDAIATELRETGELGALLARAAAGASLTAEEKRKVKAQLVDLAKVVPALAIFAAPGGMLLLPLLAKLLPFSLMPSAWSRPAALVAAAAAPPAKPPAPRPTPLPAAASAAPAGAVDVAPRPGKTKKAG